MTTTAPLKFVQICPGDLLAMGAQLTPDEDAIFIRLYLRIAASNDRVEDDDGRVASLLRISLRHWRKVKEQLIRVGFVAIEAGRIVIADVTHRLQKAANSRRQKSVAGKASSEARKFLKENDTASTAVGTAVTTAEDTAAPTATCANRKPQTANREQRNEKEAAQRSAAIAAVLEAFEQERCAVFGEGARRLYPESADEACAAEWLEAGATVPMLRNVFQAVNRKFREAGRGPVKFLSAVQRDVAMAIAAGSTFRRQLADAERIAEAKRPEAATAAEAKADAAGNPGLSRLDRDRSFWLPVLTAWRETGAWDRERHGWGAPGERQCRVPVAILREFDPDLGARQDAVNRGETEQPPSPAPVADEDGGGSGGPETSAEGLELIASLRRRIAAVTPRRPAGAAAAPLLAVAAE